MQFTTRIDIPVDYNGELFIQYQPSFDESGGEYAIGFAQFKGTVGQFEYQWPLEFLTREDVVAIRDAIDRILTITGPEA